MRVNSCDMEFCGDCPFVYCPYEPNNFGVDDIDDVFDDAAEWEKSFSIDYPDVSGEDLI